MVLGERVEVGVIPIAIMSVVRMFPVSTSLDNKCVYCVKAEGRHQESNQECYIFHINIIIVMSCFSLKFAYTNMKITLIKLINQKFIFKTSLVEVKKCEIIVENHIKLEQHIICHHFFAVNILIGKNLIKQINAGQAHLVSVGATI